MESLREHLLRIALDWPGFLDERPRGAEVRQVMGLLARLKQALFKDVNAFVLGLEATVDCEKASAVIDTAEELLIAEVFAEPLEDWLARVEGGEILAWAAATDTIAARLISRVLNDERSLDEAQPAIALARPTSGGIRAWLKDIEETRLPFECDDAAPTPETTHYSRRAEDPALLALNGSGLGPRLVARLVELARLPGELRALVGSPSNSIAKIRPADGFGWSAIEAARGLLIHAVKLEGGRIANYRVLPPTRWNFDADGIAKRCLSELKYDRTGNCGDLLAHANLIVNAIDPCVAHEVRVQ